MKKVMAIILSIIMIIGLTSCGDKGKQNSSEQEIGIWSLSNINLDTDAMKKAYEEEEMEWTDLSQQEVQEYEEFYKIFMGGLYFEFKEGGTGVLDFYVPEEEQEEGYESTATPFTWKNGKITYSEDGDNTEDMTYSIEDDILIISEEGIIMSFNKVGSLKEIENTEFWKSVKELEESMYGTYEDFYEYEDLDDTLDSTEEIIEETSEND